MPEFKLNGKKYNIPDDKVSDFLKKNPSAEPYSLAEDTGEELPFHKEVAGKGDDSVPLDIQPWYGDKMKTLYTKDQWNDFVKSTGFKPTTKNTKKNPKAQVQEFQYYLAHNPDWKSSIDELHSTDKGFGKPTRSKRKYDGFLGRRWDLLIDKKPEDKKPEPKPDQDIKLPKEEPKKTEEQTITRYPPRTVAASTDTPYWLQDIIKTAGAAGDYFNIPRYQPWQATPQVYLPEATFYDPTRELAANTEQANLANQYAAAFTGPQRLAAAQSVTQGQALKNAADIMARYNNLNVGVSNQLEAQRSDILNTAAQNKANLDTQLWDKYTVLNQQFNNSKAMARQNLRQSYMDAITNRAKAQALNTMYPNYYTDPSTGGMVLFHPDYTLNPTEPDLTNDFIKAKQLTGSTEGALDYLRIQKGLKGSGNTGISERDGYRTQQAYDPSYSGMQEDIGQ